MVYKTYLQTTWPVERLAIFEYQRAVTDFGNSLVYHKIHKKNSTKSAHEKWKKHSLTTCSVYIERAMPLAGRMIKWIFYPEQIKVNQYISVTGINGFKNRDFLVIGPPNDVFAGI